jgi:hypothetical protein
MHKLDPLLLTRGLTVTAPRAMSVRSFLLLACVSLTGCQTIVSIDPVVPDSLAAVDPRLAGVWREADSSDTSAFRLSRDTSSTYIYSETTARDTILRVKLGRLGHRWVLDVSPNQDGIDDVFRVAGHILVVVDLNEDRMMLWKLKTDSVEQFLRDRRLPLSYLRVPGGDGRDIVITAPMAELREAFARYVDLPGVLDTLVDLRRLAPP